MIVTHVILYSLVVRIQQEVRQKLEQGEQGQKSVVMWSDCVGDLWEKRLPHLSMREITGKAHDPTKDLYGFQEGDNEDDTVSDELAVSLNNDEVNEEEKLEKNIEDIKLSDTAIKEQENQQNEGEKTDGTTLPGI